MEFNDFIKVGDPAKTWTAKLLDFSKLDPMFDKHISCWSGDLSILRAMYNGSKIEDFKACLVKLLSLQDLNFSYLRVHRFLEECVLIEKPNSLKDIYLAKDHPITELKDHCSRDAKEGTNIVEYLYKEPLINLEKVHYKEKDFHKLIYDEFSLKMDPSEMDFPFIVKNKKMTHALLFNLDVDNPLTLHYHLHFLKQNNILPSVVNKFEKLKKECNLSQYYYFKSLMS